MTIHPNILRAMQEAGATIEVIIAAVEADQALAEAKKAEKRAKDAERQREYRARKSAESQDVTPTTCDKRNVTATPLSLSPNDNNSNPHTHTPEIKTRARKGTRLPADWQPKPLPKPLAEVVVLWPPGAIERELARFRDWAASASGPNAVKKDWDAAWRNWLRRQEDGQQNGRKQGNSTKSAGDRARQRLGIQ